MIDSFKSFTHWGFLLPPEHCGCDIFQQCPVYQLVLSGLDVKMRQKVIDMEEVHPLCTLCMFYFGPITNDMVKEIREGLAILKLGGMIK